MNILGHLKTVHRHRTLVRKYCFRLGLYWQGLTHDLSKYSPTEFIPSVRYYQGNRSPNDMQRYKFGYSSSWMHHKGRNRHHFEFWTDYDPKGSGIVGVEMPKKYVAEMFCDRVAACQVYRKEAYQQNDPYDYFKRSLRAGGFHEKTAILLESMLLTLKEDGQEAAYAYIRALLREENQKK